MHKKCVLVTGGEGFIGKYTVQELLNNNFDVIIADRKKESQNTKAKYYRLDVATDELSKVFENNKIDFIIHLAALPSVSESIRKPLQDCHDNYQATVNVCSYARKYNVKKIIFSSTAAVYANPEYLPVDEKHPTSFLSPYAITKNASENFIKYCGINYIIFRYANVYGKGQDATGEAGVVAKFFELMSDNLPLTIHGTGNQYRDFINVKDVAKVNVLGLLSNTNNEIINVSTNTKTTINELFEILKQELGYTQPPEYTNPRIGDIEKSVLDNNKLIKMLGYTPQIDIKNGIKEMVKSKIKA